MSVSPKTGRVNLGLEGVLVLSAMAGFGGSYISGSPWIGVLAAGFSGALLAMLHGFCAHCLKLVISPPVLP